MNLLIIFVVSLISYANGFDVGKFVTKHCVENENLSEITCKGVNLGTYIDFPLEDFTLSKAKTVKLHDWYIESVTEDIFDKFPNAEFFQFMDCYISFKSNPSKKYISKVKSILISKCKNAGDKFVEKLSSDDKLFFSQLPELKNIDIRFTTLTFIGNNFFESNSKLESISITGKIEEIHPNAFKNLKKLSSVNLSGNQLATFNNNLFKHVHSLKTLILSNNAIQLVPMDGAFPKALEILDLSHNKIEVITKKHFKKISLRSLDLSYNEIKVFSSNALDGLYKLATLNLASNHLKSITRMHFLDLNELKYLDLSYNPSCSFANDAFDDLDNMEYLNLKNAH